MNLWLGTQLRRIYQRTLQHQIGNGPTHIAIIQDGNRRYARKQGQSASNGHRAGADTSEEVLNWCDELNIRELTLYTFSTENFKRPLEERKPLFDLIESKLYELADSDRVHNSGVRIRALGDIDRLPQRVREAITYAERITASYSDFQLNVALAYGGRNELLRAAREVTTAVENNDIAPDEIDIETVENYLYRQPIREVDLIIRTGGDERTSNFLPWHANGNEAAVYFCAPYWPEFSKIDFLRAIRTYEAREESWQRNKIERSLALVRALGATESDDTTEVQHRLSTQLPIFPTWAFSQEPANNETSDSNDTTDVDQSSKKPAP